MTDSSHHQSDSQTWFLVIPTDGAYDTRSSNQVAVSDKLSSKHHPTIVTIIQSSRSKWSILQSIYSKSSTIIQSGYCKVSHDHEKCISVKTTNKVNDLRSYLPRTWMLGINKLCAKFKFDSKYAINAIFYIYCHISNYQKRPFFKFRNFHPNDKKTLLSHWSRVFQLREAQRTPPKKIKLVAIINLIMTRAVKLL